MDAFFQVSREQSRIKGEIVAKYFDAWARVIYPTVEDSGDKRICYMDLFAGPGRYEDGTESTPLAVLKRAVGDDKLAGSLVATFNDRDPVNAERLRREIASLPGISKLRHHPEVRCGEIDDSTAEYFASMHSAPCLFFIDPWGYKGLSLRLVNAVIKDWACECVFFFNYNRINMGLPNNIVRHHMEALFGEAIAAELRHKIESLEPPDRETAVVEALCQALLRGGQRRYVLPFRFRDERGTRTSHHLIFVTKHPRGYKIMKEIMAKASSDSDQGVASFEYSPARQQDMFLFGFTRPLDQLADELLAKFAGRALTVNAVYNEHNVGTPFIEANYKSVLKQLAEKNAVTAHRPSGKSIRSGFPDDIVVTFPRK